MKRNTLLLLLALAAVSCVQNRETGYIINGKVDNCGEWGNNGHVVLGIRNKNRMTVDTVSVKNGRFRLQGNIDNPDFVMISPDSNDKDRPNGRIMFFLENEKYRINVKDGIFSASEIVGGTTNELLKELVIGQKEIDEKYSIESIDMQLHTSVTPPDRMEKLKVVRREYDNAIRHFKDSLTRANTPTYFSLYMTSQAILEDVPMDSIRKELDVYLKDDRFRNYSRLKDLVDITEGKRRP